MKMSELWDTCLSNSYFYWQKVKVFNDQLSHDDENELPEEKKIALLRQSVSGAEAEYFESLTEWEKRIYIISYSSWEQCFQTFKKRLAEERSLSEPWDTCLLRSYCYWGQNFQAFDNRLTSFLESPFTSQNELPEEKKVALLRLGIGGQVAEYFDSLTEGKKGTYRDAMAALRARSQADEEIMKCKL